MDQSDIEVTCQLCNNIYDQDQRIPRILPECGHTLCNQCILISIKKQQEQEIDFLCPEDKVSYKNKNDISLFPKNFIVIRMIEKQKKRESQKNQQTLLQSAEKQSITSQSKLANSQIDYTENQRISTNGQILNQIFNENYCVYHNKKKDIVCLDCKIKVCANCALFAQHKGHSVKSQEDVMDEIIQRAEQLAEVKEKVEDKLKIIKEQTNSEKVIQILLQSMADNEREITKKFDDIRVQLQDKENRLKQDLKEKYKNLEDQVKHTYQDSSNIEGLDVINNWIEQATINFQELWEKTEQKDIALHLIINQNQSNAAQLDLIKQGQQLLDHMDKIYRQYFSKLNSMINENIHINYNSMSSIQLIESICNFTNKQDQSLLSQSQLISKKHSLNLKNKKSQHSFDLNNKDISMIQKNLENPLQISFNEGILANLSQFDVDCNDSMLIKQLNVKLPSNIFSSISPSNSPKNSNSNNNKTASQEEDKKEQILTTDNKKKENNLEQIKEEEVEETPSQSKLDKIHFLSSLQKQVNLAPIEAQFQQEIDQIFTSKAEVADLSYKDLMIKGLPHLCLGIISHNQQCKIKVLKLQFNKLTDEGAKMLLRSLQDNKSIGVIDLEKNQISDKIIDSIIELNKYNKILNTIYLAQNFWNHKNEQSKKKLEEMKIKGVKIILDSIENK